MALVISPEDGEEETGTLVESGGSLLIKFQQKFST